jgi:hypothetical protein
MLVLETQAWFSWLSLYVSYLFHLSWTREGVRYDVGAPGQRRTKMMMKIEFASLADGPSNGLRSTGKRQFRFVHR